MHFVTTLIHSLGTETYGLVWEPCPAWVGHRPLNSQIGETSKVSDNYLGSIPEGNTPWVLTYNDHYRDHGEFPAKGVDDLLALCELKELVEVAVITVHRDGHGSRAQETAHNQQPHETDPLAGRALPHLSRANSLQTF